MGSFKEKSQGFIIGILVGLIVAGSFFVFKLDDYIKELSFYKTLSHSSHKEVGIAPQQENIKTNEQVEKRKAKSTNLVREEIKTEISSLPPIDSISSNMDSISTGNLDNENIVVRKDELLFTQTIEILNLDPTATGNLKDTLLQKVSGIKESQINSKQFLNVEFWLSPLNYKGYRMSKYKLLVYGLTSAGGVKLFKLDNIIYLRSGSIVYRLSIFDDFKPYERITDESIITRLK